MSQQVVDVASENNRIDKDGMRNTHNYGGLNACGEPKQVDGGPRLLPNPMIVGHLEGPITIKPEISLLCKECTYVTNYLQRRIANQVSTIYGDEFLQNINILCELIFVNKKSRGGAEIPNCRGSRLLDERL